MSKPLEYLEEPIIKILDIEGMIKHILAQNDSILRQNEKLLTILITFRVEAKRENGSEKTE